MLAVAILLAAGLRFGLANYSPWFDEYAALFFGSQPFSRLWSMWMVRETNPPLFYSILHGWLLLGVPRTILWLRVPSLVAGILTVPVIYLGMNRFYGRHAAVVAALMLALSAQHIYYSQVARGYGTLMLATAISLFGLMAVATAQPRDGREPIGAWACYCGGAIVAIHLHDTALLWPLIATLALLAVAPAFRPIIGARWRALLIANLVILLCSSWMLFIVYKQTRLPNPNISWLHYNGIKDFLKTLTNSALLVREPAHWQHLTQLMLVGLPVFGVVATRTNIATRLAAACWVFTVLVYWAVSHKQPIIVERTVVWMGVFPLILAAVGLGSIRTRWRFLAASGLVLLLLGVNLVRAASFEVENWHGAVQRVAGTPGGALVVSGEGDAVVVKQACIVAFHGESGCPFPVLTLNDMATNEWAHGFAPDLPIFHDRLAVSDKTKLYFIQRSAEQPLSAVQAAGVLREAPRTRAFLVGPYSAAMQLRQVAHITNGLLTLPAARAEVRR